MKILHYFLGFPPYRSGGLTKYVLDLMKTQSEDGQQVVALWPGQMNWSCKKIVIKERKYIDGIHNYELINPLPVSLDEGITEFDEYMKPCNSEVYENFLKKLKLDVIHIHTLMGLHREFVEIAEKLQIRTIFTSHDYFGICPKVTLYRYGKACENDHGCIDCIQCNYTALSIKKIMIMQSPLYRCLKNTLFVKKLRKRHREKFFLEEELPVMSVNRAMIEQLSKSYQQLRKYYISMLECIDVIHFNSSITGSVYKKYMMPKSSVVMTITHKNIFDNRNNNWKPANRLRITSLAPAKPFKGFNILRQALDELWNEGNHNFELKIFSPVQSPSPYMIVKEKGFKQCELPQIFSETDVLVAPSVWYETFGFTVLEAISYGVPVIVSEYVGAKDIVKNGGIIIKADSKEELINVIKNIDITTIKKWKKNISKLELKTWDEFVQENYKLYQPLEEN